MKGADIVGRELIRTAVAKTYDGYFKGTDMQQIVQWFDLGGEVQLADSAGAGEALTSLRSIQGLMDKTPKVNVGPKDTLRSRCLPRNSFWKACMRTSASAAVKSACSAPAKNNRSQESPRNRFRTMKCRIVRGSNLISC